MRKDVDHRGESEGAHLDWVLLHSPNGIFLNELAEQAGTTTGRASSHVSWHRLRGNLDDLPDGRVRLNGTGRITGAREP